MDCADEATVDPSGCCRVTAQDLICLWALLPLDDIELDLVAFFETLVPVKLNRAVVYEDVRTIVPADEPIALRIVEPLHLAFVLRHVSVTSLRSRLGGCGPSLPSFSDADTMGLVCKKKKGNAVSQADAERENLFARGSRSRALEPRALLAQPVKEHCGGDCFAVEDAARLNLA